MNSIRFFTSILLIFLNLGCSSSTTEISPDAPPITDSEEKDTEDLALVINARYWEDGMTQKDINFVPGDEIGVYFLNDSGLSHYNIRFSTNDGKSFTEPNGHTFDLDESTKILAYYPYVKDISKTLQKDVTIPLEQEGTGNLKPMLFCVAEGRLTNKELSLDFVPVQSVLSIKLHNSTEKDIILDKITLNFDSYVSGIFRHDLQKSPTSADFALEPLMGTNSYTINLVGESTFNITAGKEIVLNTVIGSTSLSEIKLTGYAGDGDYWLLELKPENYNHGEPVTLEANFTSDNYKFDINYLIAEMNLLADSDYIVPDKHYKDRMLYPEGVLNCRDFGGIPLEEGGTTARGVIYRSAALEDVTPEGKEYMTQTLGIKTDIDLRDPSTGEAKGYSPLGVSYFNYLGPWYALGSDGIKEGVRRENLLKILQIMSDQKNYPLIFHCQVGRDRAGTIGAVLAGLAGATMKGLYEDYLISFYSSCGHGGGYTASGQVNNIIQVYEFLSTYKSSSLSLSDNTAAFLIDLGMTQSQIDTLKNILTTGNITVNEIDNPQMSVIIENVLESNLE